MASCSLDLVLENLNRVIHRGKHARHQREAYEQRAARHAAQVAGLERTCQRKADLALAAIHTFRLETGSILEVGCGAGEFTRKLALGLPDAMITATDGFAAMVQLAMKRLASIPNVVVRVYDATTPYPFSRRPDLVCAVDVIHHLEDPVGALSAWRQAVTVGGRVLLLESNPLHPGLFPRAFLREEGRFLLNSPSRLESWLRAAGWHGTSIETLPFYLPCGPRSWEPFLSAADDCIHAGRALWGRFAGMWLVTAHAM